MSTVNVANASGVSVLLQSAPLPPHGVPEYSYSLAGNRHPDAVAGRGVTYDVDETTWTDWIATNPSFAAFLSVVTDEQIAAALGADPLDHYGYENGLTPVVPVVPPVNVDVPFVWQEEQRMRCTMGNWENEPTSYSYQWVQDGVLPIGPNGDTLPLLAANDGHSIACVVTATNAGEIRHRSATEQCRPLHRAHREATAALLISGDFDDAAWNAMIAQVGSNASAWQGFDVVVDGLTLTLRAQFPGIVDAQGICNVINGQLGFYLTASISTSAPWQLLIHSNSTGASSTIGYASAPSYLAQGSTAGLMQSVMAPRKPTTDLSIIMRLRQSVGAIVVQGIDASGAALSVD